VGDYILERTRLCIVTDAWKPQVNGVVTTLTNLVAKAKAEGWEVLIIHPGLFPNTPAPLYPEVSLSLPIGMTRMIKKFKPHHLHVATEGPLGLRARFAFRKEVFTTAYHTHWEDFMWDICRLPRFLTRSYIRWFHEKGIVMAPTLSVGEYLLSKVRVQSRIRFLTRGVDPDRLRASRPRTEKGDKVRLLCVSRASVEKNLNDFCSLDSEKYDLTLVGDGPILGQLRELYPKVRFTGKLDGADLADEYQDADVFVFPSRKDTFGIVMVEAAYFGTPVAAYPISGPADVITPITGCMSENLEEAIERCLDLDRVKVADYSRMLYTWDRAWASFKKNLVDYDN